MQKNNVEMNSVDKNFFNALRPGDTFDHNGKTYTIKAIQEDGVLVENQNEAERPFSWGDLMEATGFAMKI